MTTSMFASGCSPAAENNGDGTGTENQSLTAENGISILCPKEFLSYDEHRSYGTLIHANYWSETACKEKAMNVLLPPGYSAEKKYPVLYLLHGIFGDENSMVGEKKAGNAVTITNMIASGAAEEMIVVFPFMYTSKDRANCTAIDAENVACYDNFIDDLVKSIMPFVAKNWSVKEGRENTAITGFSMGGREALACALYRQELFGWVGAIAPAPGLVEAKDFAMFHAGQFSKAEMQFSIEKPAPELVMLCAGDKDSVVGSFPASYHKIFEENKVSHVWWEIPGSDHGDPAISSGIYNFCCRVFRQQK